MSTEDKAEADATLAEIAAFLRARQVDEARKQAEKAYRDRPSSQDLIIALAQVAMAGHRWADAERFWAKVEAPLSSGVHVVLGLHEALARQDKEDAAQRHLEAALKVAADTALMDATARHLLVLRQGEELLRLCKSGALDAERSPVVAWRRCVAFGLMKRWEEASVAARRSIELHPRDPYVNTVAAEISSLQGDWVGATQYWPRAIGMVKPHRVSRHCRLLPAVTIATPWVMLAEAHGRLGNEDRMAEYLAEALRRFPADTDYLIAVARLETALKRWPTAAAAWQQVLKAGVPGPAVTAEVFGSSWQYAAFRAGSIGASDDPTTAFLFPTNEVAAWNEKVRSNDPAARLSQGLSASVDILRDAYVMPTVPLREGQEVRGGRGALVTGSVYDSSGRIAENCIHVGHLIRHVPLDLFGLEAGFKRLDGNYVYAGGDLSLHPGHFLMECMGRFWYFDYCSDKVDGVLYFEKIRLNCRDAKIDFSRISQRAAGHDAASSSVIKNLMQIFCDTSQISVVGEPTIVERLHVPQQNFGLEGKFVDGSGLFRRYVRDRIERVQARTSISPHAKVYVSRSRLPRSTGVLYREEVLEAVLERAGYYIFYPEKASVEEQISLYCHASYIVLAAGSAAHFAALAMNGCQHVAVIARRRGQAQIFQQQLAVFGAKCAIAIDTVDGGFEVVDPATGAIVPLNGNKLTHSFNVPAAMGQLAQNGFIGSADAVVPLPGNDDLRAFETSLCPFFEGMVIRHRNL